LDHALVDAQPAVDLSRVSRIVDLLESRGLVERHIFGRFAPRAVQACTTS